MTTNTDTHLDEVLLGLEAIFGKGNVGYDESGMVLYADMGSMDKESAQHMADYINELANTRLTRIGAMEHVMISGSENELTIYPNHTAIVFLSDVFSRAPSLINRLVEHMDDIWDASKLQPEMVNDFDNAERSEMQNNGYFRKRLLSEETYNIVEKEKRRERKHHLSNREPYGLENQKDQRWR